MDKIQMKTLISSSSLKKAELIEILTTVPPMWITAHYIMQEWIH